MYQKFPKIKKCIVTAGGTREYIDLVRYISNESSGKMGCALADEAAKRGLETILISTHAVQKNYKTLIVTSAQEMFEAIMSEITNNCLLFMAAAIADWRPQKWEYRKLKKKVNQNIWNLTLTKNIDILQTLSLNKKEDQIIVGFCAESENIVQNAIKKLEHKYCDYLVANDISRTDIGFNNDYNEVYLLDLQKSVTKIDRCLKPEIARILFNKILGCQNLGSHNLQPQILPRNPHPNTQMNHPSQILKGRNLLLGITGSIAAYKIPELVRLYKGYESFVQIVATENSLRFVSKLTLQTLSENPVAMDEWNENQSNFQHIHLLEKADLVMIAPITANTLAKIAQGICDNLLTTLCCACFDPTTSTILKPVILVPSMNCHMFASPAVKRNLEILKSYGFFIIPPEIGSLACGYVGEGRLPDLKSLVEYTCLVL